jgi:hypothetical protein
VLLKINMPSTQKGVDLRFNKATPMDWKEYSGRIKQSGTAIRKGDTARVTAIVVKKDVIEFQLDGGGFGTFGDDTTTKVEAKATDKSDYEKNLEKQISEITDEDRKIQLQRDLDRERARARREKQEAANQRAAQVASQMKAQQVADKRAQGGSRFNLRWFSSIPAEGLLAELSPFAGTPTPRPASPGLSRRVFLDLGSSIHPQEPNGVFESKLTAGVTPGAKRLALDDSPVQGFFFFPPSKPPSWLTRSAGFPVVFVPGTVPPAQLSSDLRIPAATPPTSGAN